ncbi:hypothetical protein PMIN06_012708 [Paraphaeosphaeria minitans]
MAQSTLLETPGTVLVHAHEQLSCRDKERRQVSVSAPPASLSNRSDVAGRHSRQLSITSSIIISIISTISIIIAVSGLNHAQGRLHAQTRRTPLTPPLRSTPPRQSVAR